MSANTRYNGWTNYETWAVKLWMDNEEPSYRYWLGEVNWDEIAAALLEDRAEEEAAQ